MVFTPCAARGPPLLIVVHDLLLRGRVLVGGMLTEAHLISGQLVHGRHLIVQDMMLHVLLELLSVIGVHHLLLCHGLLLHLQFMLLHRSIILILIFVGHITVLRWNILPDH